MLRALAAPILGSTRTARSYTDRRIRCIASDESLAIAKSYNLKTTEAKAGAKDVRGVEIGHGFIERTTFIVGKDHKIVAVMSSADDKISPDQHVDKSLAMVEKMKMASK